MLANADAAAILNSIVHPHRDAVQSGRARRSNDASTAIMKFACSKLLSLAFGVALLSFAAAQSAAAPQTVFHLAIVNQAFEPDSLTIPADQAVKIMVKNNDTLPAEFESNDFHAEVVIPGKTELPVYVRPLKAGTYGFFNDFHPQSKGSLIVKSSP
jgi:plastocyanin domain-containing protein